MLQTIIAGLFLFVVVVVVHEFGHFIVAKWAGIYVKTFSVGFGKKLFRKRFGETEYTLSMLPFGGYVKFAGGEYEDETPQTIEDAGGDSDEVPDSEIPRERHFTSKSPLKRAAVLIAGPFMNYLLAVVVYTGVFAFSGTQVIPTTEIGGVEPNTPAAAVGLQTGDVVLEIDDVRPRDWNEMVSIIAKDPSATRELRVQRGGQSITADLTPYVNGDTVRVGISPYVPSVIGRVKSGKPAYEVGMRTGAVIESINDTLTTRFSDVQRIINANAERPLLVRWSLDGVAHTDTITPEAVQTLAPGSKTEFVTVGAIGIQQYYEQRRENILRATQMGFRATHNLMGEIVGYLRLLFTGKMGVDTLGGPILITQMAGDVSRWGIDYLMGFLAFFSVNLCIFNLLPLLPFDGGHLMMFAYEGMVGRPVNARIRNWMLQGGFILVIVLMLFVVSLDFARCSGVLPSPF